MPEAGRRAAVREIAALVRWPNVLIAAAGVAVGALWTASTLTAATLWCMVAAVGFTVFANVDNDLADEPIDRVAHPGRPLPRGALSRPAARLVAGTGAVVALAASAAARVPPLLAGGGLVLVATCIYNRWLSRLGIVGNVAVALLASLPLAYGAASVGSPRVGVALAAIAAPLHLAREVAKDVDDAAGDAPFRRTLATVGPPWLARMVVLLALAVFGHAAVQLGRVAPGLPVLLVPAFACCALAGWRVVAARSGAPLLFKLAMLASMAALLLARRSIPVE